MVDGVVVLEMGNELLTMELLLLDEEDEELLSDDALLTIEDVDGS